MDSACYSWLNDGGGQKSITGSLRVSRIVSSWQPAKKQGLKFHNCKRLNSSMNELGSSFFPQSHHVRIWLHSHLDFSPLIFLRTQPHCPHWTCDQLNCELINMFCFKLLNLRWFVAQQQNSYIKRIAEIWNSSISWPKGKISWVNLLFLTSYI